MLALLVTPCTHRCLEYILWFAVVRRPKSCKESVACVIWQSFVTVLQSNMPGGLLNMHCVACHLHMTSHHTDTATAYAKLQHFVQFVSN